MKRFVFAVVLVGWLAWIRHGAVDHNPFVEAGPGDVVCRHDGRQWCSNDELAIVIVTSPNTCGACRLGKEFAEELYARGRARLMPVIYVVPERSVADGAAKELHAADRNVIRENLVKFGVSNLPTYLRVDQTGTIHSKWLGTVSDPLREKVLESITFGSPIEEYARISPAELARYSTEHKVQILALSETSRRPGSKMIPPNELDVRAPYELDRELPIVVDCKTSLKPVQCQNVAMTLVKSQFRPVFVTDLPRRRGRCDTWFNIAP